ncbi:hypothetical protein PFISCL1PPCAC_21865, partial [Pristionchus fissidentatus]
ILLQYPILDLPAEISKILSYIGGKELGICLKSFALDKIYTESKFNERIDDVLIKVQHRYAKIKSNRYYFNDELCSFRFICDRMRHVFSKCEIGGLIIDLFKKSASFLLYLLDCCAGIRCDYLSVFPYNFSKIIVSDQSLRQLISNKKEMEIRMMFKGITAGGLFAIWEDLLNGKFVGLSIIV